MQKPSNSMKLCFCIGVVRAKFNGSKETGEEVVLERYWIGKLWPLSKQLVDNLLQQQLLDPM